MRAPNGTEIAAGSLRGRSGPVDPPNHVIIDNQTSLPDNVVDEAVRSYWVENAALQYGSPSAFQMFAAGGQGSLLARTPFKVPQNVIEEIRLARSVADTDDDVKAAMSFMISTAFGEGYKNQHQDERTVALFDQMCGQQYLNLGMTLREIYREWLIAQQVTTLTIFTRNRMSFTPDGTDTPVGAQVQVPNVGILPAENIRVISNDVLGNGQLAYKVDDPILKRWLDEFFAESTSAARRAQMAREEPITAAIFVGRRQVGWNESDMFVRGETLYVLNPRMVRRTTAEKGASPYPRPLLTANFALLEAKRLLNIMDYALLQGGTNYIVVAKQGSDQRPAQQPEIDNLMEQVKVASRSGVMVGDHRLSFEIIAPKLDELLNPGKRRLLGRQLSKMMMRMPEQVTGDPGSGGATQELEYTSRVVTADRSLVRDHVHGIIYQDTVDRNPSVFAKGPPSLWFARIILAGAKDFWNFVLQARDRGDIPRAWAVEALGYDFEAGVAERKREKAAGVDDVMQPVGVPFNANDPAGGGQGRPPGSSSDNGRPGGSGPGVDPAQRQRSREPVRAVWDEELGRVLRIGELTEAVLEQYPEHAIGRITQPEREAATTGRQLQSGPLAVIPVNQGHEIIGELRALRLEDGLGMIVGERVDGAMVAKALSFREPHYDPARAEEMALRWGFSLAEPVDEEHAQHTPAAPQFDPQAFATALTTAMTTAMAEVVKNLPVPNVTVQMPGSAPMRLVRDETGAIVGSEPVPAGE